MSTTITEVAVIPAPVERVWEVISATNRYAEWVDVVLEVTDHHGEATVGKTYSERNVLLGPLTTRSTWTVREVQAPFTVRSGARSPGELASPLTARRVDTGTGFPLVHDLTSRFLLRTVPEGTEMSYVVTYSFGLGTLGQVIDRVQQAGQRHSMRASIANLAELIRSEG